MMKRPVLASAVAVASLAAWCAPAAPAFAAGAPAASAPELAQMREEIRQMKQDYETRIRALEERLQAAEAQAQSTQAAQAAPAPVPAPVPVPAPAPATVAAAGASAFNPEVSLILGGTYANLSQDPQRYRIQGFVPGGEEIGPGKRGLNLGESELTLRANVDPRFAGQLTFALSPDNTMSVEEAFFETKGLSSGVNLRGGRFLSSVGYLNGQHAHVWDFVDAPLAYQAFFGGQFKPDGLQLKWLAPTDRFFELGAEAGSGAAFPGNDRNKNGIGSAALFAHLGDDIGDSASWRAGLSFLRTGASNRPYDDTDRTGASVRNAISGHANMWIADAVYKWAPNGNATQTNFKLQGEYFHRKESGTLTYDTLAQSLGTAAGGYASAQSGWYAQAVYQFMPMWRAGLRYDRLHSGMPAIGLVNGGALSNADFRQLASYNPARTSIMFDYSPSEFSRFRLQLARDRSRPEATDHEVFLQYIMSLGAHGAHSF
ncbi:MAG TPA: hypothetical protein VJ698_18115 [Noviherbaspirillum sp.]|uniref:hypothetical protein n=1 Tax=Noviherbaspirillum sp. TaxID=1926288 RepID=UPI002B460204|nr:hypothetical protein [Noviherbaspirillum sp.]HJV87389.1 hypothetical protein [Noviherbaspirillum sp.]